MTGDATPRVDDHPTVPVRPTSTDPWLLGFTPRRPVPWLAPILLLSTGLRTLLATLFGAYLDKRELQSALPADVYDEMGADGELWLDYVADLGDGFDATYSVAYLLAQPALTVAGEELPRGRVLLMGGDQVYPTASADAYEDRFRGPYRAALPTAPRTGPQPTIYAVPGNHDWYDGLTAFLRVFARQPAGNVGGWRTRQARSYFALRLPHDWWVFGIDEQFGAYLDDPQLRYFTAAATALTAGSRVVLAVPAPGWVKTVDQPKAYETVDFFLRTVIEPTGAQVRVILAGDLHHYARYSAPGRELITCGGGGAYLASTHELPEELAVPPVGATAPRHSAARRFRLTARYPTAARSRAYAAGVFARLPWRNPGFLWLLALAQTLLMLSVAELLVHRPDGSEQRLFSIPLGIMLTLTLLGWMFFAAPPGNDGARRVTHTVVGLSHGAAHAVLALGGALLWARLPFVDWVWPLPLLSAAVLYAPVAGLVSGLLVAAYLLVASQFRVNLNELFAGQGIEDSKVFLRMHLAADGTLTIHPIAVPKAAHRWRAAPSAAPDAPWLEPERPLVVARAEEPVVIRP
ncbi:hypothetical protein GCM10010124_11230 [Pilimelia terevasa]|uniref:Metallophosphoesterase n=1 Tax=Pilimelia terevasa TaxID=53372 RepID=A0A8J3FFH6_9ACTN|nr:metallophosphoesterase [Pilimelia terevasa]GGK20371.1 hypothetical protein GCM10010124_11230 [Pilimelia terevasa]